MAEQEWVVRVLDRCCEGVLGVELSEKLARPRLAAGLGRRRCCVRFELQVAPLKKGQAGASRQQNWQ
jgi:hypothetical protein